MSFTWPHMLWALLVVPALIGMYIMLLRRKKKGVVRFASLALVREAMGPGQMLRRHIPPLLLLLATIAAIVAIARPHASVRLPSEHRTIILAIDVSRSMQAKDVEPTRFLGAQAAARTFIQEQPGDVRIGIVSFAGTAAIAQAPTQNREDLLAAIDRLELQRQTAIGSAIIVSLAAIFPDAGIDLEAITFGKPYEKQRGVAIENVGKAPAKEFTPVPPGSYPSAAIILLTDGRRTMGPEPIEAARMAADRGVRVYTVGFGSAQGGTADFDGWSMYMRFDEETLKAIAEVTRAEYFHATTAAELSRIYQRLNTQFVFEKKEIEVSVLFTAAAALLLLLSAAVAIRWFARFA